MRRGFVLIAAFLLAALLLVGASAAKRADTCTWGASSVIVEQIDGKLVQSEPVTTGCVPPAPSP